MELVDVSGTPRAMGRSHGEQCREPIAREVDGQLDGVARRWRLSRDAALHRFRVFLPLFERAAPASVEEMRGIAEGAGRSFDEILFLNALHGGAEAIEPGAATTSDGCTAFAARPPATADGAVLAGQSKDTGPSSRERYYLLRTRPARGPRVLALTYPGLLALLGISSGGVAVFGNALYGRRPVFGGTHAMPRRPILESASAKEAVRVFDRLPQWADGNFLVADAGGEMVSVESLGGRIRRVEPDGAVLVHANHILHPDLAADENYPRRAVESEPRHRRMAELLAAGDGRLTPAHCMAAFRDHANDPDSICRHGGQLGGSPRCETTGAFVADLKARVLHVCLGQPCRGEFAAYGFD